jgi:hypothetical protein
MSRRLRLGLALSFVVHALVVGAVVGWTWLRGAAPSRVDVDITGMELKDLPLGAPAAGATTQPRPRPRAPAPASVAKEGTLATREERGKARAGDDDGVDEAGAGPTDLGQLGPEGSRFTMLLRLDRLKDTPYAEPVDALLMHMPDRRDLLEGTGLSFYDDFEALLIATPNPLDYTVTFVAARHHVSDAGMRAAVDRGARATGRIVAWRSESGRPWGERRARAGATPTPFAARDARLIVLPAPGLVVVTPPAYRALLLAPARKPALARADGGVPGPADGGASEGADGGEREAAPSPSWAALLRRIDAETGLLPENAVAMASAVDLFQRRGNAPLVFLGVELELPRSLAVVLGVEPEPFIEITATFGSEAEARRWEATWPVLKGKLRTNPYVVLGGLSPLVARLTSTRDGSAVRLRLTATEEETVRLLQVAAAALPG